MRVPDRGSAPPNPGYWAGPYDATPTGQVQAARLAPPWRKKRPDNDRRRPVHACNAAPDASNRRRIPAAGPDSADPAAGRLASEGMTATDHDDATGGPQRVLSPAGLWKELEGLPLPRRGIQR